MPITPILNPFAYERTDSVTPDYTKSNPDNIANQETGFPLLQADDLSNPNATPVKEEEMNGILNFYTNILFKLGQGLQFTFDSALSTRLVGYPIGAILYCESNNTFQRSLIDNNTANFVTNPSYINDGIHWIDTSPLIVANNSARAYYTGNSNNITNPARTFAYVSEIPSITANSITRAYYTGGGSYIADPNRTFAYISELPVIPQSTKYRFFEYNNNPLYIQARIHANYDPIQATWVCSMSGYATLPQQSSTQTIYSNSFDISSIFVNAVGDGSVSMRFETGSTIALPINANVAIGGTELILYCQFANPPSSIFLNTVTFYFSLTCVVSNVI